MKKAVIFATIGALLGAVTTLVLTGACQTYWADICDKLGICHGESGEQESEDYWDTNEF